MFRPHTVAVDNEINFKLLNLNDESTKKLVNIEDYELMDKSANSDNSNFKLPCIPRRSNSLGGRELLILYAFYIVGIALIVALFESVMPVYFINEQITEEKRVRERLAMESQRGIQRLVESGGTILESDVPL